MSDSRVFLLGFDAADKDLVEQWAREGALPNFQRLLKQSLYGDVEIPRGLEAGSVWPTFYFGLRPEKNGQYDGARLFDPAIYDHRSYQPDTDALPPIWTRLSECGKRCVVIDAPYNYPVDSINGLKVVDRAGHVPAGGGNFLHLRTHPPELAETILSRYGADPAGGRSSDFFPVDTVEAVREFVDIYTRRIHSKVDMMLDFWQQEPWDFFMSVFTEAHCAGHRCWHLHDPSHPQHDAELVQAVGNPLKTIYVALDQAVGRVLQAVENQSRVILYLSHGMGPRASGTRVLDRVLARMDNQTVSSRSGWLMDLARRTWRLMPEQMRKPFQKLRDNVTNDGFQPNRAGRRFFEVYANDRTAGIRINLQGREAQGVVAPEQYDRLCEELMEEMYRLTNPESGQPVVREVIRTRDHYHGPHRDRLPDLLVTWNRSHPINFIESPRVGIVDTKGIDMRTRTGDHRIRGRFFALAADWPAQKLTRTVKTEDFVPTITRLLGVPAGETDGQEILPLVAGPLGGADNEELPARITPRASGLA